MMGTFCTPRACARRFLGTRAAAGLLSAALVAGCSSSSSWFGQSASSNASASASAASSGSDSLSDRLGNFFAGPKPRAIAAGSDPSSPGFDCPSVGIREGASTLAVNMPNADASAMNLRYQATIAHTARECAVLGATLSMKVGVQGRVILGPNGGPGQLDVPIRYALVREGPESKTLVTKLDKLRIDIPPGQTNVPFTHVEEDMTIPMPSASDLESLVVYVGFDPTGAAAAEKQTHKPHMRPKPKAKTTAERAQ